MNIQNLKFSAAALGFALFTFAGVHRTSAGAKLAFAPVASGTNPCSAPCSERKHLTEATATPEFLIAPYLFSVGSGQIHAAWQYTPDVLADSANGSTAPALDELQLLTPTGSLVVKARAAGALFIADLPIAQCGFKEVSYFVNGMPEPKPIAQIPCAGDGSPAQFAFIADAQEHPQFLKKIAAQLEKHPGSALLSDGDLVQTGSDEQDWVNYFATTANVDSESVLLPAVGNHEYRGEPNADLWAHYFHTTDVDAHYSFNVGEAHIIVLNSCFEDQPSLIDSQIPWLEKELAVPAKWKIVMFHHPPYSSGFFNSPLAPRKEFRHLQKKYVPLFEAAGVDVVLVGHTHLFERAEKNGVQYIIAGPSGGKMGIYGNFNRYSLKTDLVRTATFFTVTASHLEAQTLDPDGDEVDLLSLSK